MYDHSDIANLEIKAELLETTKRYERAMICYDQALSFEGVDKLRKKKAELLLMLGDHEELVQWVDGLPKDGLDGDILYHKAKALLGLGQTSKALVALTNAIEMGAGEEAGVAKAEILSNMGRYEEAMVCFARKGLTARALTAKAGIEFKFEKPDALETVLSAIEKDGRWLPAWVLLARIHGKAGRRKEALAALDNALGIDKNYIWAWLGKGEIYHGAGKGKKAAGYLEIALDIDPDFAEAKALLEKINETQD